MEDTSKKTTKIKPSVEGNYVMDKQQLHIRSFSLFAIALVMCLILAYSLTSSDESFSTPVIVISFICWIIITSSVVIRFSRIVKADEIGVVQAFGKPLTQVSSGYVFLFPCYNLIKVKTTQFEIYFPEAGDVPNPIRITHGAASNTTSDPLDTRLTTSVSLVLSYKIVDYISFIKTIGNYAELRKQIRDKLINATSIECARLTLAFNLTHSRRKEINILLRNTIKEFTKNWGIEIINLQLQEIDLGNEIDIAQKNLSVSGINITANKNNAEKIKYDGIAEAEVNAAFLYAKAKGLKELSEKLGIEDSLLVLQLDTLASVFRKSNADLNLYGNNFQQMFGMVMSAYQSSKDITKENDDKKLS